MLKKRKTIKSKFDFKMFKDKSTQKNIKTSFAQAQCVFTF